MRASAAAAVALLVVFTCRATAQTTVSLSCCVGFIFSRPEQTVDADDDLRSSTGTKSPALLMPIAAACTLKLLRFVPVRLVHALYWHTCTACIMYQPHCTSLQTVVGTLACGMVVSGNTTGANNTVEEPAPENWWIFTALQTGLYTFDSCGSAYDT